MGMGHTEAQDAAISWGHDRHGGYAALCKMLGCPAGDAAETIERMQARIAELEAAARWIPVGESLPEKGTTAEWSVWRFALGRGVAVGEADGDDVDPAGRVFVRCNGGGFYATHWRPLPAGPGAP